MQSCNVGFAEDEILGLSLAQKVCSVEARAACMPALHVERDWQEAMALQGIGTAKDTICSGKTCMCRQQCTLQQCTLKGGKGMAHLASPLLMPST